MLGISVDIDQAALRRWKQGVTVGAGHIHTRLEIPTRDFGAAPGRQIGSVLSSIGSINRERWAGGHARKHLDHSAQRVASVEIRLAPAKYFHAGQFGTRDLVPENPAAEGVDQRDSIFQN